MTERKEKVLGAFLGAAVGDAMGAPTETRTYEQIIEKFGGAVKEFYAPPEDTYARGNKPGQVTDDFSLAYYLANEIVKEKRVNEQVSKQATVAWGSVDRHFNFFAGPTTRTAIMKMRGEDVTPVDGIINYNAKASNGAGMKIFPVGLAYPGDLNKAVDGALQVCLPTHDNDIAISSACAIAAAVSQAMTDKDDLFSICKAGIYGAVEGEKRGRLMARTVAGPSCIKRLEMAIEIGLKSKDMLSAMQDLSDYIGSGFHASEAIPVAFGLLVAAKGDTMEAIYGGVNIGYDTDTIATMVGALGGSMNGVASITSGYLEIINEANGYDLDALAEQFVNLQLQD